MRSSTSGGDKHCQSLGYCKFQVALCFLEMYQGSYWTDLAENLMDCQVLASHPANVSFEEVCCQSSSRHSIVDSKKCAGNAEVEFGCISSITVWALVSVCSLLVSYIGCMPSLVHFLTAVLSLYIYIHNIVYIHHFHISYTILVGGLEHDFYFSIQLGSSIIPTDEL